MLKEHLLLLNLQLLYKAALPYLIRKTQASLLFLNPGSSPYLSPTQPGEISRTMDVPSPIKTMSSFEVFLCERVLRFLIYKSEDYFIILNSG